MKTLEVEYPFGYDEPLVVHCPACGARVLDPDEEEEEECPHLLFIFSGMAQTFYHASERAERLLAQAEAKMSETEDEGDVDDYPSEMDLVLRELPETTTSFVMDITTGGMGCGPVWETLSFCFDLVPQE